MKKGSKAKEGAKVKAEQKKLKLAEEHKRYEKDDSSDDEDNEMPEVVSNAAMKEDLEALNKQVALLKAQLRQEEKLKRRKKQEIYIAQKKAKLSSMAAADEDGNIDDLEESHMTTVGKSEMEGMEGTTVDVMNEAQKKKLSRPTRKVYPSLNITVEPLTKSEDCRASAALNFKSRRMANVPRESVKTAVISYKKKLQVRK